MSSFRKIFMLKRLKGKIIEIQQKIQIRKSIKMQ